MNLKSNYHVTWVVVYGTEITEHLHSHGLLPSYPVILIPWSLYYDFSWPHCLLHLLSLPVPLLGNDSTAPPQLCPEGVYMGNQPRVSLQITPSRTSSLYDLWLRECLSQNYKTGHKPKRKKYGMRLSWADFVSWSSDKVHTRRCWWIP